MGVEEVKKVIFFGLPLLVLAASTLGLAAGATPYSVFNNCQPETLRQLGGEELEKDWFTMRVAYGEGFNPVFLPFTYRCEEGEGDPNQALTFPALLSFKFDFVPDNYSARHPAFIFRRDPDVLKLKADDRQGIAAYIKNWAATHAVAGELIESRAGYKGKLQVFDIEGEPVLTREYPSPVPYFTLMGQMVIDWMNFRGQEVSPGLADELFRPMTSAPETVQWYGESFDVEWRSPEEWAIYERILARDPFFGEVQFWYANQRGWEVGNESWTQIGKGKALLGHLVIPALWEFSPARCPDESLVANYREVLDYAEEIMPADPRVIYGRLKVDGGKLSVTELNVFADWCYKYPCYHPLLDILAENYYSRGMADRALPLFMSAVNSGFLSGTGSYDGQLSRIGLVFEELGFTEEAVAFFAFNLQDCSDEYRPWLLFYLGRNLREAFQYEKAARLLLQRYIKHGDRWSLLYGYMSLFEGGLSSTLQEWETSPVTPVTPEIRPYYLARKAMMRQDTEGAFAALRGIEFGDGKNNHWLQLEAEIIRADALLLAGREQEALEHAFKAWYLKPRSKRTAFLLTQAAQKDLVHLTRFAQTACFIFPEEQYWQQMLAQLTAKKPNNERSKSLQAEFKRLRAAEEKIPDEEKVQFWLETFPFTPEYLCLHLVQDAGKELREEALRFYLKYAVTMRGLSEFQATHLRVFFLQLVRLLPESEQEFWVKELDRIWDSFSVRR